ncbi:nuclear transport factor 2 family protein [Streptomyces monomycini]|uniref:nuclear transport factor 2 family protein n=1 Tax=Streptomyces monomycini TaxID=371720 RepID=UPI00067D21CA|nr:nuclear transport factor 2 family protein [Streptomyces monomycini]
MSASAQCSPPPSSSGLSCSGQKDAEAVWSVITGLYAAHGTGATGELDILLDPDATMWHSESEAMLLGRKDLDRLRAERTAGGGGPEVMAYDVHDPVIDVSGHMAVVGYWLRVDYAPAPDGTALQPELVRNTAVLRRSAGAWRIAHLHEEVWAAGGMPETADPGPDGPRPQPPQAPLGCSHEV